MSAPIYQCTYRAWCRGLIAASIALLLTVASSHRAPAQEGPSPQEIAMFQYITPLRFGRDLKVGDRVKYQSGMEGELQYHELEVTKKEGSNLWIHEEMMGQEFDMLIDPGTGRLLKIEYIDESGNKASPTLLDESELAPMVQMMQAQMQEQMAGGQLMGWEKGAGTEGIDVPAGTFTCTFLEPTFSQELLSQLEADQIKQFKADSRLYFSEEVPRMFPMQIAMGWALYADAFKEVKGGVIATNQAQMGLKLAEYSRK